MKTHTLSLVLALLPAALFAGGNSGATTPANAIPGGAQSAPFVISKPGYYYLTGDRTMTDTSKNAIEIASSDVTLDLGGYAVRFSSVSGSGTAIHGKDVQNIEVRNGAVTVTPWDGVSLTATGMNGANNLRVIDVRASAVGHSGIVVEGNGAVIDRCTVDNAGYAGISAVYGNATTISNCAVAMTLGIGIDARSPGVLIRNTNIANTYNAGIWIERGTVTDCQVISCNLNKSAGSAGIYMSDSFGSVKNTLISSCYIMGIYVAGPGHQVLEGNVIAGTLTAGNVVGGAAIFASVPGYVLAMNNRYSLNTTVSAGLNGAGNIVY
jgi:hypothetical protein